MKARYQNTPTTGTGPPYVWPTAAVAKQAAPIKTLAIGPAMATKNSTFAFGGSCLPKDLRALLYLAKTHDVDVPMLAGMLPSNRLHVDHAAQMILERGERSIGIIGLSFKSGTDDLRESPLVDLVERLIGKGMNLKIYDPEVRISQLMGANKRYIEEVVPHIGTLMCESVEEAVEDAATVVVGLSGDDILDQLREHAREDQFVLDLVGIPEAQRPRGEYRGICW